MVLRQCFRFGDGNVFIAHAFLVFFSADEEKKHVYALEYFVAVWFFSSSAQHHLPINCSRLTARKVTL
jgi:hypothetical protein